METKLLIEKGQAVLGIEFGSTRIKAVLIDDANQPLVSGYHDWENQLIVFCKTFLDKVAKHFWTLLHVQIGQSCKASASPE